MGQLREARVMARIMAAVRAARMGEGFTSAFAPCMVALPV